MSKIKPIIEEKPQLNELMHYGIPGMKWGVRKAEELAGRALLGAGRLTAKGAEAVGMAAYYAGQYWAHRVYDKYKHDKISDLAFKASEKLGKIGWDMGTLAIRLGFAGTRKAGSAALRTAGWYIERTTIGGGRRVSRAFFGGAQRYGENGSRRYNI